MSLALRTHGGEHEARLQAERVSFANGNVEVTGGEIIGFGAPIHFQVRISPAELYVCAHSRGTQLGRIAHFTGSPNLAAGRLSFDVDGTLRPDSANGHLSIDLAEGKLGTWSGSDAHVEATLEGRSGSARITAKLPDAGSLEMSAQSIQLGPGSPLRAAAWRGAWGAANLTAHVDLGKLAARLPPGTLPVSAVSGSIDVQGHVARDSGKDMSPDIDVNAKTSGLLVDGPRTDRGSCAESTLRRACVSTDRTATPGSTPSWPTLTACSSGLPRAPRRSLTITSSRATPASPARRARCPSRHRSRCPRATSAICPRCSGPRAYGAIWPRRSRGPARSRAPRSTRTRH